MHGWSIISRAAGTMPLAITADTASPAVRRALKSASSVRTARATGRRRTLIRVAIPKFPSEPTNRPTRSGPHGSPPGLPWGPDLVGLFVGSEGNFGIATRISVRLLPVARAVRTLLADFSALRTAGEAVSAVIASGIVPAALEMM